MNNELREVQNDLAKVSSNISKLVTGINKYYGDRVTEATMSDKERLREQIEKRRKEAAEALKVTQELEKALSKIDGAHDVLKVADQLNEILENDSNKKVVKAVQKTKEGIRKRQVAMTDDVLKKVKANGQMHTTYSLNDGLRDRTIRVEQQASDLPFSDKTGTLSDNILKQKELQNKELFELKHQDEFSTNDIAQQDKSKDINKYTQYKEAELQELKRDNELGKKEKKVAIKKASKEIKTNAKKLAVLSSYYDKYHQSETRIARITKALELITGNIEFDNIKNQLEQDLKKENINNKGLTTEVNKLEQDLQVEKYVSNYEQQQQQELQKAAEAAKQELGYMTKDEQQLEAMKAGAKLNSQQNQLDVDGKRIAAENVRKAAEQAVDQRAPMYGNDGNVVLTREELIELEIERLNKENKQNGETEVGGRSR